jgi:UDP-glucose 4-epimerase
MKILVTGGAGFIGSHLVDSLVQSHDVVVADNLRTGKVEYINPKAKFVNVDVTNFAEIEKVLRGGNFDIIYHLAAHADIRNNVRDNTRMIIDENFTATHNILEAMRVNDVKKIVFTSTSALYGDNEIENQETNPLIPISIYAATKIASEKLITAYCYTFGMQSWIFRPPNVVGPRGTHGVINDFVLKLNRNSSELEILGKGKQRKSYFFISDCIESMLFCIAHANDKVNIFNLATGDIVDVTTLARIVVDEMNLNDTKFKYTNTESNWIGDVRCIWLSIDKIKSLGWNPKYNSEQSIRLAVGWAKDNLQLLEKSLQSDKLNK